jgi:tetratricopeptide (TPR) repeat protein
MQEAVAYLQKLLDRYPNHRETQLTVAEIYDEMGLEAEANEVRSAVIVRRRPSRSDILPKVPGLDDEDAQQAEVARKRSNAPEAVEEIGARVRDRYQQLLDLNQGDMQPSDAERFRRIARSLVTEFQSCDRFFGEKRLRPFCLQRGKHKRTSKKKGKPAEEDSDEYDSDGSATEAGHEMDTSDGPKHHLGLHFDEWFQVHEMYSQFLVRISGSAVDKLVNPLDGSTLTSRQATEASTNWLTEALNTMNLATRANIFYYNKRQLSVLKLMVIGKCCVIVSRSSHLDLAIALRLNDEPTVYECIRWFLREYRDVDDFCALYGVVMRGPDAIDQYRQQNSQKFFIRQIDRTDNTNPFYLTLQGHVFALTGSSSHALLCFGGSQQMRPEDPLAAFNLALGFLHRGIQRSTKNRHYAFMQAFAFMQKYAELRTNDPTCAIPRKFRQQECMYNMGRAMHTIGAIHLAVHFYRRALLMSDQIAAGNEKDMYDLRVDAAYNLAQIYVEGGAKDLAKKLYERYCVF